MKPNTSIIWFRQDLRLEDNSALTAAVARGGAVVPVFIWSPKEEGDWPAGRASRWWLHHSLEGLSEELKSSGSSLVIRRGKSLRQLEALVKEAGATAVYFNQRYEPAAQERDRQVMAHLAGRGIDVFAFNDSLLFDPALIRNRSGEPYRVFTPFWKRLLEIEDPGMRMPKPKWIPAPANRLPSRTIDDLFLRKGPDPVVDWTPGEAGAHEALQRFLNDVYANYEESRDRPGLRGTSRLSPHLHFGEISPRRLWYDVKTISRGKPVDQNPFLRQLAWREFSYHLLHHYPHTPSKALRAAFDDFPWRRDPEGFRAWTDGKTGYPLVDAGMRELSATGWMHNRVRMVAASFLIKHLLIDWRDGARWFWENLVDADLANNTMGWQWVAGCGADAAPFFRIFNPVVQGRKFDTEGEYVKKWVPELSNLPLKFLHEPWKAPAAALREAGVQLGGNYPAPVVDHAFARERALEAYAEIVSHEMSIT